MQDTGSTPATYKRLFIPNPFSSDEENEAKKSAQQQEEDAGNAIKDFMTGVWDSLAGTVMGLLTLVVDLGTLYVDVRWKSVVPIQVPEVLDQEVEKIKQKYEPLLKDPVNTIGGIGQSICDTADEKGVAYSSGYIVTEVVTALLADKGLDKTNKLFKNQSLLDEHYGKHGQEIADVLGDSNYSIDKYLDDANYIINNGTYAPELNGYVSFMSGKKYGFVGLDRTTGDITTFHIKNISELIKKAPSLGFER